MSRGAFSLVDRCVGDVTYTFAASHVHQHRQTMLAPKATHAGQLVNLATFPSAVVHGSAFLHAAAFATAFSRLVPSAQYHTLEIMSCL